MEYKYIEHNKGVYEGNSYDYVLLSDGLQSLKVKNLVPEETLAQYVRGDSVDVELEVRGSKTGAPVVVLKNISAV